MLLVFDTLRPDFISPYGGGVKTKGIERLAKHGTRVENAYAVGPSSSISHGGIFSGLYPSQSGIVGNCSLPPDVPSIPDILRQHGYDTFGISGPAWIGSDFNFDRGFSEYIEIYNNDLPSYTSPEFLKTALQNKELRIPLLKDLLRVVRSGKDDRTFIRFEYIKNRIENELDEPFFVFTNFMGAHSPYDAPRPYKEEATPELDRPRWFLLEHITESSEKLKRDDIREDRIREAQTTDGIARYLAGQLELTEEEFEVLRKWYRAEIRYLDYRLNDFLDWFFGNNLQENTLLLVTADHGEYFGEHDLIAHSNFLFDECLHVPLFVVGPNVPEGVSRDGFSSLVDILPTFCDAAGIEEPETPGRSLLSEPPRDYVVSEHGIRAEEPEGVMKYLQGEQFERFRAGWKGIRTENWLLTESSNGKTELYRREESGEQKVESPKDAVVEDLRELLHEEADNKYRSAINSYNRADSMDEDVSDQLKRLGYLE